MTFGNALTVMRAGSMAVLSTSLVMGLLVTGCSQGPRQQASSAPLITNLSPVSGPVGTTVMIAGTNFGATQGASTVTFNGTASTPTTWSATNIVAPVPTGATTGNVVVTVGGRASNAVTFTVTTNATLQSISVSPNPANVAAGSTLQFAATGHYSDGSAQDITTQSSWTSGSTSLATIVASTGLASGISFGGPITITATDQGINGIASLTVTGADATAPTVPLLNPLAVQTATLLNDGRVLLAGGGAFDPTTDAFTPATQSELFDPMTGTFSASGGLITPRYLATAVLLQNGKVLILGGSTDSGNGSTPATTCELYDPATETFSATASLPGGAALGFSATLLNNGEVLVAGGVITVTNNDTYLAQAELYDPTTGKFTATGSMTTARSLHSATLLDDGTVLIAGGEDGNRAALSSAEIYNPATGIFTATGSMTAARILQLAVRLNGGQVLIAGGGNYTGSTPNILSSAELYDPVAQTFTATGDMTVARTTEAPDVPTITLLNNGTVLLAGGGPTSNGGQVLASTELYDPTSGTFTASANMSTARTFDTGTLLDDGGVLLAGGIDSATEGSADVLSSAEIYQPSNLTPPALVSIAISPASTTIVAGAAQVYVATGTFSDNSTQVLASVTWSSSDNTISSISNDASNKGCAYGVATGTVTITATAGTTSGSATLKVE